MGCFYILCPFLPFFRYEDMKNDFETVIKEVAAFLGKEVTLYIYPENQCFFIQVIDSFFVAFFLHMCFNFPELRLMNPL